MATAVADDALVVGSIRKWRPLSPFPVVEPSYRSMDQKGGKPRGGKPMQREAFTVITRKASKTRHFSPKFDVLIFLDEKSDSIASSRKIGHPRTVNGDSCRHLRHWPSPEDHGRRRRTTEDHGAPRSSPEQHGAPRKTDRDEGRTSPGKHRDTMATSRDEGPRHASR